MKVLAQYPHMLTGVVFETMLEIDCENPGNQPCFVCQMQLVDEVIDKFADAIHLESCLTMKLYTDKNHDKT